MQQHSAQHLFSAIAEKYGYDTTTWSLGEERCNVELVSMDTAAASVEAGKKAGTEMNMIPADVLEKIEVDVDECIPESVCSRQSAARFERSWTFTKLAVGGGVFEVEDQLVGY
uniref:Threonyl/alanyl tRNA synthetase SAD domain-containing protein n=1 Tax=Phytophthora ramorum TaxID=164328 RepID=H3GCM2_PHYRM